MPRTRGSGVVQDASGKDVPGWMPVADATPPVDVADVPQIFWEMSNDLLIVTDAEGMLTATNPAWRKALGWTVAEHPHLPVIDLIHESDRSAVREVLGSVLAEHRFESLELRLRTADGGNRTISWNGVSDGQRWYVAGRDVTEVRGAERTARDMAEFWQAAIDSIGGEVAVLDDQGRIVAVNQRWREFGHLRGRIDPSDMGKNYLEICDEAAEEPGAAAAARGIRDLLAGSRDPVMFDYPLGDLWYVFSATAFAEEGPVRIVVTHTDVTARRRDEEGARAQAAVFDQFELAVVTVDADNLVTRWNTGAERLYGWSVQEAVGVSVVDLMNPHPVSFADGQGALVEGRWESTTKDGETRVAQVRWSELVDAEGQYAGTVSVAMDVSRQVRAEGQVRAARHHLQTVTDSISEGLFALGADGRITLMNKAAEAILGWTPDDVRGQRLHDVTRHRWPMGASHASASCPVGGGGRVVGADRDGILRVNDDVFIRRDGRDLPVRYTVSPLEGAGGWVVVFADSTGALEEEERLERELRAELWFHRVRSALVEDRFRLHAQPIVDLATMEIVQHELLLRVVEQDGSLIGPAEYLAASEEYGLIGDIDRWVLRSAFDLAATGRAVEVNLSGASVGDPQMLADIERWLAESGADPAVIVFEITETAVVENEQAGRRFVDRIHELGCEVAIDDFGAGYSGFAYLKQLDADFVKIDIEFVRDLRRNAASRLVVEAVVTLAKGLGMRTVAEGVEDAETLELVRALGVDCAQGHHLGRPAPF